MEERRSVRTKEREGRGGGDPSTSRFTFTFNLFKTILIGLKLPTFYFSINVWTEDIFLFGALPVFGIYQYGKTPLGGYQHVYEMISLLIRLCYAK